MNFLIDKQTFEDLNIDGKYKSHSIYSIFNKTITRGGERVLENLFKNPLTDAGLINNRVSLLRYFTEQQFDFPFTRHEIDCVEQYLNSSSHHSSIGATASLSVKKFHHYIAKDKAYELLVEGVENTITVLKKIKKLWEHAKEKEANSEFLKFMDQLMAICPMLEKEWVFMERKTLTFREHLRLNRYFRVDYLEPLNALLEFIHQYDVYTTIARVAHARDFSYASATAFNTQTEIEITGLYHPALEYAKVNDLVLDKEHNVMFLTGANMAGKSTLMKSFGIALFLAHIGFPIAASSMRFTVMDGLYSSINVSDNLAMGYSHFYSEVRRVKNIAEQVCAGKRLVVIFDELFKGTNVKDAFDATVAVINAFGKNKRSIFMVSTHIVEAGQTLQTQNHNFIFMRLPTIMKGKIPTYTYKLESGLSEDRHGMMIINNERIIETILAQKEKYCIKHI